MPARNGFSLLELMICLGLAAVVLGGVLVSAPALVNRISARQFASVAFQSLYAARAQAMAQDQDVVITAQNGALAVKPAANPTQNIAFPPGVSASINGQKKLGFTNTGNTKYSGTLSLADFAAQQQITVGVGFGKVSIK